MIQQTQNQKNEAQKPTSKHKKTEKSPASVTTFSSHVSELRKRTFFVALAFIVASGLAYSYHDFFVALIMRPLGSEKLIYLTPGGGFNFIFQVSLYVGIIVTAPILIYQLYGFIKPALPKRAQRSATKVVLAAFSLMLCGVCYGYLIAVPSALHFLSTFAGDAVTPNLTADSYLSFFLAYIAGLGVLFELPLLLLFFHWIHPMTPGGVLKSERFVILLAFVAAAIITPTPDVFNQCMIALPLILIYQLGVVAVLVAIRKEKQPSKRPVRQASEELLPELRMEAIMPDDPTPDPIPTLVPASAPPPVPAPVVSAPKPPRRPRRTVDGFGPVRRTAKGGPLHQAAPKPPLQKTPSRSSYGGRLV